MDLENKIGCYLIIWIVFSKLNYFFKDYDWIGCLVNDMVFGLSLIIEFVRVGVM